MPFNGVGNFLRLFSWRQDRANGITVNADRMDDEMDGFADGLSNAMTLDGQSTVTDDLPMNNHKFTGLAAGTTAGDSARFEQLATVPFSVGMKTPETGNYTILSTDVGKVVPIDTSLGAATVTLPSAVTVGNGYEVTIVKSTPDGNFVTINAVNGELLGYPSRKYPLHATAGTAVSNNGGHVRIRIAAGETDRIFYTGDIGRIEGAVGFSALNDDHIVTRPLGSSGVSESSLDLEDLPYVGGYSGGATLSWIHISTQLRKVNGSVTLKSNGTHWVYKHKSDDVFAGPSDFLFGARNPGYVGAPTNITTQYPGLDMVWSVWSLRDIGRSRINAEDADPTDDVARRFYKEYLGTDVATSLPMGSSLGVRYFQGSTQLGNCEAQSGSFSARAAENITTAGHGAHVQLGSTPIGEGESISFLEGRENQDTWIGGAFERGSLLANAGLIFASATLTASGNVSDGDTVTIDGVVYTFETGAIDAAFEVDVGATADESLANLSHAINLTGTAGTTYGAGTTAHPTVHAFLTSTSGAMSVKAQTAGTGGNSLAISESSGTLSWSGGTLSGGEAANISHLGVKGDPTGATLTIRADAIIGGVSNIDFQYRTKGTGSHKFFSDGGTIVQQFEVKRTASATRWLTATGSNGGNPLLGASAGYVALDTPAVIKSYTVGTLPSHSAAALIYISDETLGAVLAYSDGSNWVRTSTRVASTTDNTLVRMDGTGGKTQGSSIVVTDGGGVSGFKHLGTGVATLADDTATSYGVDGTGGALVAIACRTAPGAGAPNGLYFCRPSVPTVTLIAGGSTNITLTTGILSGTTSTDGNFNISAHTDGNLYLENRTGASRTVNVTVLSPA